MVTVDDMMRYVHTLRTFGVIDEDAWISIHKAIRARYGMATYNLPEDSPLWSLPK